MKEKIKKYAKWIVVFIVLAGCVSAITGGSSDDSNEPKTEQKEKKGENKEDDKDDEKSEPVYTIGQTLTVGDVEYTVNSINTTKIIGTEYLNHEAQEMYLVINITLKNNDDKPLTVSDEFFKLKRDGKEYSTDSDGSLYLEDNIIFDSINPEATLTGNICFDVTQETIDDANLQLQVQTGAWGTEKGVINLH